MTPLIILLFILPAFAVAQEPIEPVINVAKTDIKKQLYLKFENNANTNNTNATFSNTTFSEKPLQKTETTVIDFNTTIDYGALRRLFFVLLGLCTLTIIYVSYRFYRTHQRGIRPTTVRKYGVLTQRTDIEMLPLPLDDDEDDDTVFDVGNHMNR